MEIEKIISPFIQAQFPVFYEKEGPNFIAFLTAYYEWMEQEGNIINQSRSLLEYRDIDTTMINFIKYFKDKYMDSIPEHIASDKKLLIKHILELYRSKGNEKSYRLLFRILFNEDIDIYIPNQYIFKLSDNNWSVPKYIEVSDSPYLSNLVGQKIYSSSTLSTGVVESYFVKNYNNKLINVIYLTTLNGNIHYGEKILCESVPQITVDNAPIVFGSLSSVSITQGGLNFNVGDILNIEGGGIGGLARVAATKNRNGEVTFDLVNGGKGFSANAIVNVDGEAFGIANITNTSPVVVITNVPSGITSQESLRIDLVQGMTNINTQTYQYYANVINTTAFFLYSDQALTIPLNGTTFPSYQANTGFIYLNTGGSGASFKIGSLVNKQIYKINTDIINTYYNTVLDSQNSGYTFGISNSHGTFSVNNTITLANVNVKEIDCLYLNNSVLANGENLSNTSLGIANLTVCKSDGSFLIVKGNDITNANLNINTVLISNTNGALVRLNYISPLYTINATATIVSVNSSVMVVNGQSSWVINSQVNDTIYLSAFVGQTLLNTNATANAYINTITRNTNWGFPAIPSFSDNLDQPIQNVLSNQNLEVGTIATLTDINTGINYSKNPFVTIIEPSVYALNIVDPNGSIEGFNATVNATAGFYSGIVSAVDIVDSGFGYDKNQPVNLLNANNEYSVSGITVVDSNGIGKGSWQNHKSFASDIMYLQDGNFYQNYSYQIIAQRMVDTYEQYVIDLIHPVGIKLFGAYALKDQILDNNSTFITSSFTQS